MNSKQLLNKYFHDKMIYLVTEQSLSGERNTIDICKKALQAGIRMIQLRDKSLSQNERYNLALHLRKLTHKYNALLFIDDSVDIAIISDADGVHLGQDDLPYETVKKHFPNLLIGVSTHNLSEVKTVIKSNIKPDYINIGPIYKTNTKKTKYDFIGIDNLKDIIPKVNIPFTVMGGIKEDKLPVLIDTGGRIFAMVTEITQAKDVYDKCSTLMNIIT